MFGLKLTEQFFRLGGRAVLRAPDVAGQHAASLGAHAMLCVGYSEPDQVFIARNSWGQDWGDGGYCYVPYSYMADGESCAVVNESEA